MHTLPRPFNTLVLVLLLLTACNETNPTDSLDGDQPDARRSRGRGHLVSTFNHHADGWTVVGDARGATIGSGNLHLEAQFDARAGNPGGAIFATDEARGLTFFFQAPHRYLGNRARYYGGALEYDLKFSGPGDVGGVFDVVLNGDGMTLVVDAGPNPTTEWSSYRVALDESAGWRLGHPVTGTLATRADIRSVLRNLNVLRIRGEYTNDIDTGFLDNVRMVR